MNPGSSVKDRAALGLILDAEKKLKFNGKGKGNNFTIVEGTAGNTGIGLAHICRAKGYNCEIFMPNTQSQEKINTLRSLGANVHLVPPVPYTNENNFNHLARKFAEDLGEENAIWTNQFDNVANSKIHYSTTGPEIWNQLKQYYLNSNWDFSDQVIKKSAFICSTGTGGTWSGTTEYLKQISNNQFKSYIADPPGSVIFNYVTKNKIIERCGESSITEGIGQGRITENMKLNVDKADGAFHILDEETIEILFRMIDEEGIFVGASSALNIASTIKVAQELGPNSNIVTIASDSGDRYRSRILSESWLRSKNLYDCIPKHLLKYVVLP